eukprot:SAG31_NODE_5949_length_2244_cov_2.381818_3_plen_74_part_00
MELDADKSGFLDMAEVEKLCIGLGKKLGKKELVRAMADMDQDGNNEVSFDEFQVWWRANGGKSTRTPRNDPAA